MPLIEALSAASYSAGLVTGAFVMAALYIVHQLVAAEARRERP